MYDPSSVIPVHLQTAADQSLGSALVQCHYFELGAAEKKAWRGRSLVAGSGRLLPVSAVQTGDQKVGPKDAGDEEIQYVMTVMSDCEKRQFHQASADSMNEVKAWTVCVTA